MLNARGYSSESRGGYSEGHNGQGGRKNGLLTHATGHDLRKLFEHRHDADYAVSKKIDQQTAREDLAAAQTIVEACRRIVEASIAQ